MDEREGGKRADEEMERNKGGRKGKEQRMQRERERRVGTES